MPFANCLVISSYATGKYNVVDTLGMNANKGKMGYIGCLVRYLTSSDSEILDSGRISKHSLKEKKARIYLMNYSKKLQRLTRKRIVTVNSTPTHAQHHWYYYHEYEYQ